MSFQARTFATGPAHDAAEGWLEQFVYEIEMLQFAAGFAHTHAKDIAAWREQSLGIEGVLVHARILDAFLSGQRGEAVPAWAPFGSATDCVAGFEPRGFLTVDEFQAITGALGRFGSYSSGFNTWRVGRLVERALDLCLELAQLLPADDADLVMAACTK